MSTKGAPFRLPKRLSGQFPVRVFVIYKLFVRTARLVDVFPVNFM